MPATKPSGRSDDRGRPRERERRPPGTHRERSRERNVGRSGQHKSRSPNRPSKTAPPRSSAATIGMNNSAFRDHNVESRNEINRFRPEGEPKRPLMPERHRPRERENAQQILLQQSKLRMDRDGRNKEKGPREVEKPDWHAPRKHQDELDRVVKRAREERSSYWNKRVIEAEEKDPNRWGHSGFKELYRRDMKLGHGQPQGHGRSRSQSPLNNKHFRGSPERQLLKRAAAEQRLHQRRTRSRSRSRSRSPRPKAVKPRNNRPRSLTPPSSLQRGSNFVPVGARIATTSGTGISRPTPLLRGRTNHLQQESKLDRVRDSRNNSNGSDVNMPKVTGDRRSRLENSSKLLSRSRMADGSTKSSEFASSDMYRNNRADRDRALHKKDSRGQRNAISKSMSRSRTRSSASPPPSKLKRTSGGSARGIEKSKTDSKSKEPWSRNTSSKKDAPVSRSHSRSSSSSSSSSEDEDVLEIHADDRRKGRGSSSISRSSSSSSDDDSKSNSASSSRGSSKRKKDSGSSSSSSSSDSDSDDESDISGKITMDKRKRPYTGAETGADKAGKTSSAKEDQPRAGAKRPSSASTAASSSKTPRTSVPTSKSVSGSKGTSSAVSSREKEKSVGGSSKGDSDSESGSTSDSSDEPRMTLSERFAKLTQMSTDKREFAKPLLAVNEIDTKLKVVKDLRNADVKIYVDGPQGLQHPKSTSSTGGAGIKAPPRPKSPVYTYSEGEKRYSSDERRRHFERMERDEPNERPADWSDARVRFEYYRDRGYFNDRPLNFDEYVKWEQWWYQYRDWLQTEGYYPRMGNPASRGGHYPGGGDHRGPGPRGGDWVHGANTISSRMRPGPSMGMPPPLHGGGGGGRRVEQVPMRLAPLSSRPHFMGRSDGPPPHHGHGHGLGRSIDRAPGGSLIVNIRQGSSYGPRGRQVGLIRGRNR